MCRNQEGLIGMDVVAAGVFAFDPHLFGPALPSPSPSPCPFPCPFPAGPRPPVLDSRSGPTPDIAMAR